MRYQYIGAYDPGHAVGYSLGYISEHHGFELVFTATYTPAGAMAHFLDWKHYPEHIRIMETFVNRGSNEFAAGMDAPEVIGAAKMIEIEYPNIKPIVWQSRTDKALVDDKVLKDYGLWRTPMKVGFKTARHINDATKHCLVYLIKQKHIPTLEKYGYRTP